MERCGVVAEILENHVLYLAIGCYMGSANPHFEVIPIFPKFGAVGGPRRALSR